MSPGATAHRAHGFAVVTLAKARSARVPGKHLEVAVTAPGHPTLILVDEATYPSRCRSGPIAAMRASSRPPAPPGTPR